jgi:hypothetical protein
VVDQNGEWIEHLVGVVTEFGLPDGEADDDYRGYHHRPFEKYVEVQVWSDQPIADIRWESA